MVKPDHRTGGTAPLQQRLVEELPRPTETYRRRAWLDFQRALDPLARPKPLRPVRS